MPITASGSDVVVMVGAAGSLREMVNVFSAGVRTPASVSATVNSLESAAFFAGVPEIRPVLPLSSRPAGSAPSFTLQVRAPFRLAWPLS